MFRQVNVIRHLWLLALIAYNVYLKYARSLPFGVNPLFLFCDGQTTLWLADKAFTYLLLPAHVLEAAAAAVIATWSGKHGPVDIALWTAQTFVYGFPSLQLLLRLNRPSPPAAAGKR